jgi:hypothetical protein
MEIKSRDNNDRILYGSQIDIIDKKDNNLVKKIILTIEAGEIADLEVEEYISDNNGGVVMIGNTLTPLTKTSVYCIDKLYIRVIERLDELNAEREAKEENEKRKIEKIKNERFLHLNSISQLEI